jgi:HEPN domain-containing protein
MDYKTKYLKYKTKYVQLKKQIGGNEIILNKCTHDSIYFVDYRDNKKTTGTYSLNDGIGENKDLFTVHYINTENKENNKKISHGLDRKEIGIEKKIKVDKSCEKEIITDFQNKRLNMIKEYKPDITIDKIIEIEKVEAEINRLKQQLEAEIEAEIKPAQNTFEQAQKTFKQAEETFEQAKNTFEQPKNTFEQAEETFKQTNKLKRVLSKANKIFEQAKNTFEQAKTTFEQAKTTFEEAQKTFKEAEDTFKEAKDTFEQKETTKTTKQELNKLYNRLKDLTKDILLAKKIKKIR